MFHYCLAFCEMGVHVTFKEFNRLIVIFCYFCLALPCFGPFLQRQVPGVLGCKEGTVTWLQPAALESAVKSGNNMRCILQLCRYVYI